MGKGHRRCEVCGIKEAWHTGNKLSFSKFPLDPNRCREWLKAVGNEELVHLPIEKLHEQRNVCAKHFGKKDLNKKGNRLKRNAIPTLNLMALPLTDGQLAEFPQHVYRHSNESCPPATEQIEVQSGHGRGPGPSGLGAAKRVRPDDTASPSTLQGDAKRVKTQTAQGEERTYARASKDTPARLAVAICLSPPSRDMTTDEAEHIKLSLEALVMDADPSKPLPGFRGYPRIADGTIQMWCEDDNALTWLTENVPRIRLPDTDATLTVMKQPDVPTRVRAALFVPRYNGDIARLQSVLTRQNSWYDIGRWSLYRATAVGGDNHGTYLTLGIPPDEVEKVLGRERRVSYLLGSIYVRFFPKTQPSDTQTTTTNAALTQPTPTDPDLTMTQLEEEIARAAMADADAVSMQTSPPGWTEQLLTSSPSLSDVWHGLKEKGDLSDGSVSS